MGRDVIRDAIEKLERDLEKVLSDVKKKKQAINVLYETIGEDAPYQIEDDTGVIQRDQFYGKPFATAASEFLKIKTHALTAEEILNGLEKGGYNFSWVQKERLHGVAVSLGKNSTVFHRLPNGTYGLSSWYPETQMKRTRLPKGKSMGDADAVSLKEKEGEGKIEDLVKE